MVSNSLRPHELQHTRHPCPSPTPGAYSNSCPSSGWCHPTISSSVFPFSSCPQSFSASGSFLMSQFFESGGQSIGVSASTSVLSMNIQDLFPLGWLIWSLCSPRDSQEFSPTPQFKSIISLALSFLYSSSLTSIHDHWKNHSFDYMDLCWQSNVSAFSYSVWVCHSFSSKEQMSFNFMAAVIICSDFEAPQNKVSHYFHCFPICLSWSDGTGCQDLSFLNVDFKPTFSLSSFAFIKRLFSSPLSAIRVVSSTYLRLLIFLPAILIPVCDSSSLAFLMMCYTYKLNKQGDNRKPWCALFLIWNQSVVPCPVLTVASWSAYRFLRRQVRWSGIPISLRVFHSLLWSAQSKALA